MGSVCSLYVLAKKSTIRVVTTIIQISGTKPVILRCLRLLQALHLTCQPGRRAEESVKPTTDRHGNGILSSFPLLSPANSFEVTVADNH